MKWISLVPIIAMIELSHVVQVMEEVDWKEMKKMKYEIMKVIKVNEKEIRISSKSYFFKKNYTMKSCFIKDYLSK